MNSESNDLLQILFVDDDPAILDGIRELFSLLDIELRCASNGLQALEALTCFSRLDLLITDFRLPEYDGTTVVRKVRERLGRDLPAVILTGETSNTEIERAGIDNCRIFNKPVDFDELLNYIESIKAHQVSQV